MTPETYLRTALQYGKERDHQGMVRLWQVGLKDDRGTAQSVMANLLSHGGEHIKSAAFEAMISDGGVDLMPLIIQTFQGVRDEDVLAQRFGMLSEHTRPEALDVLEAIKEMVGGNGERALRRAQGKLRARFREHYYTQAFRKARGRRLLEVTEAMLKAPHPDYRQPMIHILAEGRPAHVAQAARVLVSLPHPEVLPPFADAVALLLERNALAVCLSELAFFKQEAQGWNARRLLRSLAEREELPIGLDEAEKLARRWNEGAVASDINYLLDMFGLAGEARAVLRARFTRILMGTGTDPGPGEAAEWLHFWEAELGEALRQLVLCGMRLATRLEDTAFPKKLEAILAEYPRERDALMVWFYAGGGKRDAGPRLAALLSKATDEERIKTLLKALAEVELAVIPDEVMLLARDATRHGLRRAALNFLAKTPQGPAQLCHLLAHGTLTIKDDVGATIATHHLQECVPTMIGFLSGKITDSFRLIIFKTLEHFEGGDIIYPLQPYLLHQYTLPVRVAALQTLFAIGGADKLAMIIEILDGDAGKRHRTQIMEAFLDQLSREDIAKEEDNLLKQKAFIQELLHFPHTPVRLKTLDILDRFTWDSDLREGWVGLLQKALQSLVAARDMEETERLRALIARVSARFESERKAASLRRRLGGIVSGLSHHSRIERIQALKQLDWIFRPEMISGDPLGVKRLVSRIERIMLDDAGDTLIEVLAIEVAGKIGHPALRRKLKDYLDHPDHDVVMAARQALEQPVNEVLLANLIKSIFHIDDSTYMTRMVSTILEKEGFKARGANDPKEAIKCLRENDYDLLVLDLNMPAMRGVDFLKHIRRLDLAPRFTFVLTSVRTQDDLMEVFNEGIDGVMLKPFKAEDLVARIRELRASCK